MAVNGRGVAAMATGRARNARYCNEIRAVGYDLAIDAQGLFISGAHSLPGPYPAARRFRDIGANSVSYSTLKNIFPKPSISPRPSALRSYAGAGARYRYARPPSRIHLPQVPAHQRDRIVTLLRRRHSPIAVRWSRSHPGPNGRVNNGHRNTGLNCCAAIFSQTAANVVLVGSRTDKGFAETSSRNSATRQRLRILNLIGMTALPELYALLQRMAVTIAADTAPLHAAGAAHCAHLIGIYGPTSPGRTGPVRQSRHHAARRRTPAALPALPAARCRYGTNQCMREVGPAHVFAALSAALSVAREM